MQKNILFVSRKSSKMSLDYYIGIARKQGLKISVAQERNSHSNYDLTDYSIPLDLDKHEEAIDTIAKFNRDHKIDGILHYEDFYQVIVAKIAQSLVLPYISVNTAMMVSNKYLMKERFIRENIPCAKMKIVSNIDELKKTCIEIGYPVVVKPICGTGSIGVVKIDNSEELIPKFEQARIDTIEENISGKFLVEEYLEGPEISVESIVYNGKIHHLTVTDKLVGEEPYFIEIGHNIPSKYPKALQDETKTLCTRGIKALEINMGGTHTEIKISSKGLKIEEIHGRLAGGGIPILVRMATSVDPYAATIDIALGKEPYLEPKWNRAAAVRFLNPINSHKVFRIEGIKEIMKLPGVCFFQELHYRDWNDLIFPPRSANSRIGMLIITGNDLNEINSRANLALRSVQIKTE